MNIPAAREKKVAFLKQNKKLWSKLSLVPVIQVGALAPWKPLVAKAREESLYAKGTPDRDIANALRRIIQTL